MSEERPDFSSDYFRCSYMAGRDRCMNRGVFKRSLSGSGDWICIKHSNCKGQTEGALIVAESKRQHGQKFD
jgi:hypothetical protein